MEELEMVYIEKEKERKAFFAKAQEDFGRLESKLRKSLSEVGVEVGLGFRATGCMDGCMDGVSDDVMWVGWSGGSEGEEADRI